MSLVHVIFWALCGAPTHAVSARCYATYDEARCAALGDYATNEDTEVVTVHAMRVEKWEQLHRECGLRGALRMPAG